MTPRGLRWLLFAALAAALPLPYLLAEPELAPWVRLAFLTGLMLGVAAADGVSGTSGLFAALLLPQLLLWTALLWLAARLAARALAPLGGRLRAALVGAALAGLLALSLAGVYRTPHSSAGPSSGLLQLFR